MTLKRRIKKIEEALMQKNNEQTMKMTHFPPAPRSVSEWVELMNAIDAGGGFRAKISLMRNKRLGHGYNAWLKEVTNEREEPDMQT